MGKKKRKSKRSRTESPSDGPDAFSGGFGSLMEDQGLRSSGHETKSAELPQRGASPSGAPHQEIVADAHRWIVRISKKGRGGREATLLSPRGLSEGQDLGALAKRIRRELGCGATLEGDGILVQGDQRDRLERWLDANGARKVTQG